MVVVLGVAVKAAAPSTLAKVQWVGVVGPSPLLALSWVAFAQLAVAAGVVVAVLSLQLVIGEVAVEEEAAVEEVLSRLRLTSQIKAVEGMKAVETLLIPTTPSRKTGKSIGKTRKVAADKRRPKPEGTDSSRS